MVGLLIHALVAVVPSLTPMRIECVDSQTKRGVPLVQLTTSGYISYYSDSAGIVAFDEPGEITVTSGIVVYIYMLMRMHIPISTPLALRQI
eukprot:SAG11_NODE_5893_length_1439_cov_1.877612_2_plen_91_part_00